MKSAHKIAGNGERWLMFGCAFKGLLFSGGGGSVLVSLVAANFDVCFCLMPTRDAELLRMTVKISPLERALLFEPVYNRNPAELG